MKKRVVYGAALVLLALMVAGCPERTNIRQITSDPGRFEGKEVTVGGRVVNSYGVLDKGVYEIDDGTGRIWIFTERSGVPSRNATIGVTGKITGGLSYGGRNYGTVVRETKRHTPDRAR
jgi:hypothetical protein